MKLFRVLVLCLISILSFKAESSAQDPDFNMDIKPGQIFSSSLRMKEVEQLAFVKRDLFVSITQQFFNLPDLRNISSTIPQTVSDVGFFHRSGERLYWSGFSNIGSLIDTQLRISVGLGQNYRILPENSEIVLIDHEYGQITQGLCAPVFILYEDREVEQMICRVEFPLPSQTPFDPCYDFVTGQYICRPIPKPELELVIYQNLPTIRQKGGNTILLRHFFRL